MVINAAHQRNSKKKNKNSSNTSNFAFQYNFFDNLKAWKIEIPGTVITSRLYQADFTQQQGIAINSVSSSRVIPMKVLKTLNFV